MTVVLVIACSQDFEPNCDKWYRTLWYLLITRLTWILSQVVVRSVSPSCCLGLAGPTQWHHCSWKLQSYTMMHLQSCDKYPPIKGREDAHMYVTLASLHESTEARHRGYNERSICPGTSRILGLGTPSLKARNLCLRALLMYLTSRQNLNFKLE